LLVVPLICGESRKFTESGKEDCLDWSGIGEAVLVVVIVVVMSVIAVVLRDGYFICVEPALGADAVLVPTRRQ
jgi:hypothetical protein